MVFLFVLCRVCDSKLIRDVIHLHICNFIDLWTSTYYAYEFVLFCCCSQPTRSDQVLVNNLSMWSMSGYHSTLHWCMYLNDAASVTRPIASRDFRRKIKESFYKESEEIQKNWLESNDSCVIFVGGCRRSGHSQRSQFGIRSSNNIFNKGNTE